MLAAALVVGALLLAATVNVERSSALFVVAGIGLAAVWVVASVLVRDRDRVGSRPLGTDLAVGVAVALTMFGAFVIAAALARHIGVLEGAIDDILSQADDQTLAWVIGLTAINAVAEEVFFRGALMNSFPPSRAVVGSTVLYVAVTLAGGNLALAIAATVMGTVFAIERRATGSVVMPIVTHLLWSLLMVTAFPRS